MKQAVIYARVSSKDQEREGYSIPAQLKLLREYARTHEFEIVREFLDVETAKIAGRKQFGEMVRFLRENSACRTAIVEKTDRLYRNFRDCVTLEDLDIEIHLPKEGQVISKDSKSQAKLVHGIQVVIARNYIENLREEVRKGMREKAEQGIYPSRPPLGYRNNKLERTIEADPNKTLIAQRMFELYGSGQHSLTNLRKAISNACSRIRFTKASSFGKASSTAGHTSRWLVQLCSSKFRKFSEATTNPSTENTHSLFRVCCVALMTTAPSRRKSKRTDTRIIAARDSGASASCLGSAKKNSEIGLGKYSRTSTFQIACFRN